MTSLDDKKLSRGITIGIIAFLVVYIAVFALAMQQVHAVTRFENCLTRSANEHQALTFAQVKACFAEQFKDAPPLR